MINENLDRFKNMWIAKSAHLEIFCQRLLMVIVTNCFGLGLPAYDQVDLATARNVVSFPEEKASLFCF